MQIPMSTANGQTVMQTVQVPVQSLQGTVPLAQTVAPQPQTFTLTANGMLQSTTSPADVAATEGAGSKQGSNNVQVGGAAQSMVALQSAMAQTLTTQQLSSSQAAVLAMSSLGNSSIANILAASQGTVASSAASLPTVTVGSIPQTITTPSTASSGLLSAQTVQNIQHGAQSLQNILLPSGQIVQAVQSQQALSSSVQNIQAVGPNGQIVQGPLLGPVSPINIAGLQRTPGVQPIQIQNYQSLQNIQNISCIQTVQGAPIQNTPGQVLNGTHVIQLAGGGQQLLQAIAVTPMGQGIGNTVNAAGGKPLHQIEQLRFNIYTLQKNIIAKPD